MNMVLVGAIGNRMVRESAAAGPDGEGGNFLYRGSMRDFMKRHLLPSAVRPRRILFGPAAGAVMEIDPASEFRMWLGLIEAELSRHFRRLVYRGARCFDIGGAAGYHAVMLAKLSGERVAVFEPGAGWPEKIERELARNGLEGVVAPVLIGSSVSDGCTTIDQAARTIFTPDFVKMDIEGAEAEALKGASAVLSSRKPHLIVEVHGAEVERQCLELLGGHGYSPTIVNPRGFLKEYRPIENNRWLVCEGRWPAQPSA